MSATITQDETIRTITVYDPDSEELSEVDAHAFAFESLSCEERANWTFESDERLDYNKVKVRFQLLYARRPFPVARCARIAPVEWYKGECLYPDEETCDGCQFVGNCVHMA